MKILFISLPDIKKIYPQRPHQIIKRMARKHDITVLSVNAWWLEDLNDCYLEECLKDIRIIYMSNRNINTVFQEISNVLSNKEIEMKSFDMIISLNDLITSFILSKKVKIPMIFDICDDLPKYIGTSNQIPKLLRPMGEYVSRIMMDKNIKMSYKVIITSEYLRKKYNIPTDKSLCIPNGVDTQLFYKNDIGSDSVKKGLGIEDGDFIVGFVGYIGEWVDIESPLIALKMLRDYLNIKMLVIGNGDKLHRAKTMTKELGISENIIFTGNIPYLSVPKYINCMDVCLLPFGKNDVSENAVPLKLFEYMACEKPVISTPLLGVKNIVGNKIIYSSGPQDLAIKIKDFYINDKLSEIGKEGRVFVEKNYSWETIYNSLEKAILK